MKAHLCPRCGSGKTSNKGFAGARCYACGWRGDSRALLATEVAQDGTDVIGDAALGIAQKVAEEYMRTISAYAARDLGRAMIDAGIVGAKDSTNLARLIKAACVGAYRATLSEVTKIQEELHGESGHAIH